MRWLLDIHLSSMRSGSLMGSHGGGEWWWMEKIGFNVVKKTLGFKLGPKELRCCMEKNSLNIKTTATFVQVPALSMTSYHIVRAAPHIPHDLIHRYRLQDPMGIYQKILAGKITFPKIFHKEAGIFPCCFPSGGWGENRGVTFYLWIIFDPYWESCIVLLLIIIL